MNFKFCCFIQRAHFLGECAVFACQKDYILYFLHKNFFTKVSDGFKTFFRVILFSVITYLILLIIVVL